MFEDIFNIIKMHATRLRWGHSVKSAIIQANNDSDVPRCEEIYPIVTRRFITNEKWPKKWPKSDPDVEENGPDIGFLNFRNKEKDWNREITDGCKTLDYSSKITGAFCWGVTTVVVIVELIAVVLPLGSGSLLDKAEYFLQLLIN